MTSPTGVPSLPPSRHRSDVDSLLPAPPTARPIPTLPPRQAATRSIAELGPLHGPPLPTSATAAAATTGSAPISAPASVSVWCPTPSPFAPPTHAPFSTMLSAPAPSSVPTLSTGLESPVRPRRVRQVGIVLLSVLAAASVFMIVAAASLVMRIVRDPDNTSTDFTPSPKAYAATMTRIDSERFSFVMIDQPTNEPIPQAPAGFESQRWVMSSPTGLVLEVDEFTSVVAAAFTPTMAKAFIDTSIAQTAAAGNIVVVADEPTELDGEPARSIEFDGPTGRIFAVFAQKGSTIVAVSGVQVGSTSAPFAYEQLLASFEFATVDGDGDVN